jgi:hypothetical protein
MGTKRTDEFRADAVRIALMELCPKNQGLPQPQNRPRHGLQADDVSQEKVAEGLRAKPSVCAASVPLIYVVCAG